jgi:hypothetical protein
MTYQQFLNEVFTKVIPGRDPSLREGQALMNYVWEIWPEEAEKINKEYDFNVDCFYNNRLIPDTLKHLETVWENKK